MDMGGRAAVTIPPGPRRQAQSLARENNEGKKDASPSLVCRGRALREQNGTLQAFPRASIVIGHNRAASIRLWTSGW
jgi:hypothetical protein